MATYTAETIVGTDDAQKWQQVQAAAAVRGCAEVRVATDGTFVLITWFGEHVDFTRQQRLGDPNPPVPTMAG